MRKKLRLEWIAPTVLLAVLLGTSPSCHIARFVGQNSQWNIPNTITEKGFRYTKKGVEVRYQVDGIFPAKLDRAQLMAKMNVAQGAYYHFWKQAGGIKDNQRLVNVVVEVSFVHKTGSGAKLFMVVHMLADVVELDAAGASTPPSAPAGGYNPATHPSSAPMIQRIARSIERAMPSQPRG